MKDINSYKISTYDMKKYILELKKKNKELENSIIYEKKLYNKMENNYKNIIETMENRRIKNRIKNKLKRIFLINYYKKKNNKNNDNMIVEKKVNSIKSYNSWYEENRDFSGNISDIKPIVFYLPQFHTFKENDEWWGKGFTEWTNTKKSLPRFPEHYQPREPHDDIGYYILDNVNTIKKQVDLAKQHGIYGFAFYYYWFSGKTLMTKPIDLFLQNKDENFKFCLCWANENWSRRWDGSDKEILIKQEYSKEDPINFIKDIKKYLLNNRYIKIDNKPLIMIYNPDEIVDYEEMIEKWRSTAKKIGIGELYIIQKKYVGDYNDKYVDFVDAEFDFAPNGFGHDSCKIDTEYTPLAFDYEKMVDDIDGMYNDFYSIKNFYFSSTMGWDNSARRKKDYRVYCNYNPKSFYKWLRYTIRETRRRLPEDKRYILVNAWNEWAEGTYLEPDKKYGYTNINTLSKAIYDIPMSDNNVIYLDKKKKISNKFKKKIAVQVHVYYIDIYLRIIELLKNFPYDIDLYITTTDKLINNKVLKIAKEAQFKNVKVESYDNKGRDIYPFICQMSKVYKKYDFILKLHTKKTLSYDNDWCEYLLNNLIGDKYKIVTLLDYLDKNGGILYPVYYKSVLDMLSVGGNKNNIDELMNNMNFDISKIDLNSFDFPTGSMFYVESNILKELFEMDKGYMDKDFNNECIDGTYAHAIERIFGILPLIKNKKISLFKFK